MRQLAQAALLVLGLTAPLAARADVAQAIDGVILPDLAAFDVAASALADRARESCAPDDLRPLWNAAFDAWIPVGFLHLGPGEDQGRNLAIAFWPDAKGIGAKQQRQLIAARDPAVDDPALFSKQSVALRGFFALERLLWPTEPPADADYACALTRATAIELARLAAEVDDGWRNGFAATLLTAGQPGNDRYLSQDEARQALFTALMAGFEFVADQRIGRPLGTFDRPRPERAEARASDRPLRNVELSLVALRALAQALAGDAPDTAADLDRALATARALGDPAFSGIDEPQRWLKLQILQQQVRAARDTALIEVGDLLGVGVGFNSADGD